MSKMSKRDLVQRFQFSHTFGRDIVPILSSILTDLCDNNDKRNTAFATKFQASARPPISVFDYLERIYQYADCSETCFVLALIFIDRIQTRPEFLVTSLNIHRLLITSIMLSAKFFDDQYYNNAFYARIGGITTQEINQLELEFLFNVGFSLAVSPDEFGLYYKELYAHAMVLRGISAATSAAPVSAQAPAQAQAQAQTSTSASVPVPVPGHPAVAATSTSRPSLQVQIPVSSAFPNAWSAHAHAHVASAAESATPSTSSPSEMSPSAYTFHQQPKNDSPCGDKRMRICYESQSNQQSMIFS